MGRGSTGWNSGRGVCGWPGAGSAPRVPGARWGSRRRVGRTEARREAARRAGGDPRLSLPPPRGRPRARPPPPPSPCVVAGKFAPTPIRQRRADERSPAPDPSAPGGRRGAEPSPQQRRAVSTWAAAPRGRSGAEPVGAETAGLARRGWGARGGGSRPGGLRGLRWCGPRSRRTPPFPTPARTPPGLAPSGRSRGLSLSPVLWSRVGGAAGGRDVAGCLAPCGGHTPRSGPRARRPGSAQSAADAPPRRGVSPALAPLGGLLPPGLPGGTDAAREGVRGVCAPPGRSSAAAHTGDFDPSKRVTALPGSGLSGAPATGPTRPPGLCRLRTDRPSPLGARILQGPARAAFCPCYWGHEGWGVGAHPGRHTGLPRPHGVRAQGFVNSLWPLIPPWCPDLPLPSLVSQKHPGSHAGAPQSV